MDADDFRSLITSKLREKESAVSAIFARICALRAPATVTVCVEVEIAAMTDDFPVSIFTDGLPVWNFDGYDVDAALRAVGPLLTRSEQDEFTVFETGPHGPQEALEQPVLDKVNAEATVILPWLVGLMKAADFTQMGCEVVAGLHDSAELVIVVPKP